MAVMTRAALTRRRFLSRAAASAGITMLRGIAKPYLSRAADRPVITRGVQSGDVWVVPAVVGARAAGRARMFWETAPTDSFADGRRGAFVDALPETDCPARALVGGFPADQDIFYRIRF